MEKNVNVGAEAIKQISKEKARIFRKRTEEPSLLEKIALAWKEKKDKERRQRQREALKKGESLGLSFRETVAKEVVDHDKQRLSETSRAESRDEIGWTQFNPWKKEGNKKKKEISINTATIVAIRKKIIAEEWRRALGKPKQDNKFRDLEQEATIWRQRKEEAERRREEMKIRVARHRELLSEALVGFAKGLREKKDSMEPKALSIFLEESLGNAGEVFDIDWQEKGCFVWIEPWEEKKRRKISGIDIPVIYRVKIDEDLQISSYEEVEDEEIIESLREELLTRSFRESLEGISFNIDNEDEAKQFLEDRLLDIGRLINLERTENGWLATIEPWEEMRIRNARRRGKPPMVTDEIEIDWKDGKLEFAPEEEGDDIEEEEENTMSLRGGLEGRRNNPNEIASAPSVPRNDEIKEGGKEDERD